MIALALISRKPRDVEEYFQSHACERCIFQPSREHALPSMLVYEEDLSFECRGAIAQSTIFSSATTRMTDFPSRFVAQQWRFDDDGRIENRGCALVLDVMDGNVNERTPVWTFTKNDTLAQ
jgi:hypothetical protein